MGGGLGITYNVSMDNDVAAKALTDILKDAPQLKPYRVVVGSPHAKYVEFGAPPRRPDSNGIREAGSGAYKKDPLFKALLIWYKRRNSGIYRDEDIYLIYSKILRFGTPPQPFIRPAIHHVEGQLARGETEDMKSFEDIARTIKEKMIEYLEENHTIYPGGLIKETIKVEEITDEVIGGAVEGLEDIDQDIWDSDYKDYKGNEEPAQRRWEKRSKLKW